MTVIICVAVIILDQVSKYFADTMIAGGSTVPLIPGVLELANVHNAGVAWGMLQGGRWIFIVLTVVVSAILVYYLFFRKDQLGTLARGSLSLILAGAVGNLIDRACLGYVRDMIYVSAIHFPVFNIADSAVTVGAVLLLIDTIKGGPRSFFNAIGISDEKKESGKETVDGESVQHETDHGETNDDQ